MDFQGRATILHVTLSDMKRIRALLPNACYIPRVDTPETPGNLGHSPKVSESDPIYQYENPNITYLHVYN